MAQSAPSRLVDSSVILRKSPRMVSRMVSGEHILVPLASRGAEIDSIFNLNATGSFIWERIDGAHSSVEIVSQVAAEFQVSAEQARADCEEFLAQLLEVKAIEVESPSQGVKN